LKKSQCSINSQPADKKAEMELKEFIDLLVKNRTSKNTSNSPKRPADGK
jgi:hypothetical protein